MKVKDLGHVHPDWMPTFMAHWKMELELDGDLGTGYATEGID
jgi:hypothetical protein